MRSTFAFRRTSYTLQGWLSSAASTSWQEDLFYASPAHSATSGTPGKAGLVTEWKQQQKGTSANSATTAETFAYTYDLAGRLTNSVRYSGTTSTSDNKLTEQGIAYDRSGNLTALTRRNASGTATQTLSYAYNGPKRTTWTYDNHGNVTADPQAGVTLAWNAVDLPRSLTSGSASTQRAYLADGTLAQVASGTSYRLYLGDLVFTRTGTSGTPVLESAAWEGGRLIGGSGTGNVLYHVTDHLGSVRVVKDGAGTVRQRFDYYPYGSVSRVYTNSSTTDNSVKRYRFGGKEIAGTSLTDLAGTGAAPGASYLDFGARLYSPGTATWLGVDPMAEKYYGIGPLTYCAGSPVNFVDPTGRDWYTLNENGGIQVIEIREGEQFDRLFLNIEVGPPDITHSIKINDRSILQGRSNLKEIPLSSSFQDMMNIFYFASDSYMGQEWGLYLSGDSYSLVTSNGSDHVLSPYADGSGDKTTWKIHSHSNTPPNDRAEIESMGYWFYFDRDFQEGKLINKNAQWYEATPIPNDLRNLRDTSIPSHVYFPRSGHVYQLNKNSLPNIIRKRH